MLLCVLSATGNVRAIRSLRAIVYGITASHWHLSAIPVIKFLVMHMPSKLTCNFIPVPGGSTSVTYIINLTSLNPSLMSTSSNTSQANYCNKQLADSKSLADHKKICPCCPGTQNLSDEQRKPFKCPHCYKRCTCLADVLCHSKAKHPTYSCAWMGVACNWTVTGCTQMGCACSQMDFCTYPISHYVCTVFVLFLGLATI